jgi:hypothetical protein
MLSRHSFTDVAFLLVHRAGGWMGQRVARTAGAGYLPAALRRLERQLPVGSLVQRRFHHVCSMVGDLNGAAELLERRVLKQMQRPSRHALPPRARPVPSRPLSRDDARAALQLVVARLHAAGVTPFLSFGTLLGAVREGSFMAHDTDIDLGFFPDEASPERLRHLFFWGAGLRLALPSLVNAKALPVKLRHRSGASIDLIPFERRPDAFITRMTHQNHVLERRRRPFGLRPISFEGTRVCVPDPPEAFLDENYGDWRVRKTNYHCVLSSRMPFDPHDPLVRYLLYAALDDALARGACERARWLAREALEHGMQGASLAALANTTEEGVSCASTPR